ncbi:MAG: tetratricopeptide repeat protein [Phormidesmis sp.]
MTSVQSRGDYGYEPDHTERATALFNEGRMLMNQGHKSDAFDKFEAALKEIEDCDGSEVEKLRQKIKTAMS